MRLLTLNAVWSLFLDMQYRIPVEIPQEEYLLNNRGISYTMEHISGCRAVSALLYDACEGEPEAPVKKHLMIWQK